MNDLVSIIIPIYNTEKFLRQCIQSIVNQTYTNIEIILINDGSTDNSINICKQFAKNDNRIIIIDKKNEGVSIARNIGIKKARGEYIAFIDSDDTIEDTMIEKLMNNINNNNADVAICGYKIIQNKKTFIPQYKDNYFLVHGNKKYEYLYNEYSLATIMPVNKIYKNRLFTNIQFEPNKRHEDEILAFKVLKKAQKISYIMIPLYNYYKREGSFTSSFSENRFDALITVNERDLFFQKIKNEYLIDQNYYYKFSIVTNILTSYMYSKIINKRIEKRIEDLKKEIKPITKKIIKSKNINVKRKIKVLLYLYLRKVFLFINHYYYNIN